MYGYGNSMFLATHGILAKSASGGGVDADAQAFITAASITDPTQQSAINQLVVDLKGYGVWSKMKAIYPFVGGTASTHKWNLKDPRDLDVAFRLVFSGGWTHSSTGATPNGTNAYADTKFNPSINASLNSHHFSFYSRTNSNGTEIEAGLIDANGRTNLLEIRTIGTTYVAVNSGSTYTTFADTDSRAFYLANRTASNVVNAWRNSTKAATGTTASTALPNGNHWLGGWNNIANPALLYYSTKQCAFASIGDGLDDTEAANFYTAVQAFQVTLGRSIGTQSVSDADAQAFVTNAGIVDQVEANAVNNLVIGLKADGLWSKMQAIYPFVGGTATTHKFNLKNPLDTNAAFRLSFLGGWTHSSTGATPNGTNAYADSFYNPNTNLASVNSAHLSYYSRTNATGGIEMGGGPVPLLDLSLNYSGAGGSNCWSMASFVTHYNLDSRCFMINSRTASNSFKVIKNGSVLVSSTGAAGATKPNANLYLGKRNYDNLWSTKECAFASIGDGLSDTEATNLNTRVTTFQTALNRNV